MSGGSADGEAMRILRSNADAAMRIRLGPTLSIDAMFWLAAAFANDQGPGITAESDEFREGIHALLTGATLPAVEIADGARLGEAMLKPGAAYWFDIQDALERARLNGLLARVRFPEGNAIARGSSKIDWAQSRSRWIYGEDLAQLSRLAVDVPYKAAA